MDLAGLNVEESNIYMNAYDAAPKGQQEKAAIAAVMAYRNKDNKKDGKTTLKSLFSGRKEKVDKAGGYNAD